MLNNCEKCGRFVGQCGLARIIFCHDIGEYELCEALCSRCLKKSCPKINEEQKRKVEALILQTIQTQEDR